MYKCPRCKDTDMEHKLWRNPKTGIETFEARRCPDCKTRRDQEIREKFDLEQDQIRRGVEHEERAKLGQASGDKPLDGV
jgi:hypothetical protein